MMFEQAKNMDAAFRAVRQLCWLVVVCCFLLCGFTVYRSYKQSLSLENKMYVMAGDKVIEAFASDRRENLAVEARDHVRMFHSWFFTLDPDEKVIQNNLSHALYLADRSAKQQYDNLTETGYYANIISGNISQSVTIDSVLVDTHSLPYVFRSYGYLTITRPTSIVKRSLITQGLLRPVSRSDHNPHGFLIEKWETIDNRDLSTETRRYE
jgi:conjugative transposon TraK protein